MKGFGSDNHSGIHPQLLVAISAANLDHAPAYGTDSWSENSLTIFKRIFGAEAQVHFVFNGTAANVLALKTVSQSFNSVFCSDISHLNQDECAAPEIMGGFKLLPLPSKDGKISIEALQKALIRRGDQHYPQASAVSLTQPTELGNCYSREELKAIIEWAHKENLFVHLDGARLVNACVYLDMTLAQMTTELGVDVVSFGGTKNGLLFGEAVIVLNKKLGENFKYQRKQLGQLPSKTRFIAAQFSEYLGTPLWQDIATHSLKMSQLLYQETKSIPGVEIRCEPQSNAVFAKIPQAWVKPLREKFFFYVWDENTFECRWMTSWDSTPHEIYEFANLLRQLSQNHFLPFPKGLQ